MHYLFDRFLLFNSFLTHYNAFFSVCLVVSGSIFEPIFAAHFLSKNPVELRKTGDRSWPERMPLLAILTLA